VPHAGTLNASGGTAFVVTDDTLIRGKHQRFEAGKQFHTEAQWREASTMMVGIEETLCKARTGSPATSNPPRYRISSPLTHPQSEDLHRQIGARLRSLRVLSGPTPQTPTTLDGRAAFRAKQVEPAFALHAPE
jgi:hypothetical protein